MSDIETTPNTALLLKQLEWATSEVRAAITDGRRPEWDQGTWIWSEQRGGTACGTACCIAGRTVLDAGIPLDWEPVHDGWKVYGTVDGRPVQVVAADLLGLDEWQAADLFRGMNTLADLWTIAGEITGGQITPPADLNELTGVSW